MRPTPRTSCRPLPHPAILLLLAWTLCGLAGCQRDNTTLLHQYQPVPQEGWSSQSRPSFVIDSVETAGDYTLSVELRTTTMVPFQTIYVAVEQQLENPEAAYTDTVAVTLTDTRGNLNGEGVNLYSVEAAVGHSFHYSRGQTVNITLRHLMRQEQIEGIKDVGIRLQRT